ncbi:chitin binding peritrophin-A domain-containing protein, partial [Klebsiella pneumoniae]|uniref:chitin binding peritrophin-A domain-containing protein n=1 Tax=Klebsiella pneumoniae TaxID=573 RepID=UPI0039769907
MSCGNKRTRIPVPDDCHDFLDCTGENKPPERVSCAPGMAFDAVRRMCLPEAQVAACQKVTIIPTPTQTVTPKPTEGAPCQVGQR